MILKPDMMARKSATSGLKIRKRTMKPSESNIADVECSGVNIKEIKKMIYRGLEIYAVKRSTNYSYAECSLLGRCNKAWWCGYVEVPLDMYGLLKPGGYLNEKILYGELDDLDKYGLTYVHGGYTYIDYGIPRALNDDQRLFLGWDYNHWPDYEDCVTCQKILKEGMKVIESMLNQTRRSEENGHRADDQRA